MVQTRSSQRLDGSPAADLPYRKRRADDEDEAPASLAKKPKRSTPRAKLPLRPPTQEVEHDAGGVEEAEESEISIYTTPATDTAGSVYATPATNLKSRSGISDETPSLGTDKSKRQRSSILAPVDDNESTDATSAVRRIRFASEEPSDAHDGEALESKPDEDDEQVGGALAGSEGAEEDDSDDDAPEEVTTGAAAQEARGAQVAAAKARRAQDQAARDKRRRREDALQEQARNLKKQKGKSPRQRAKDVAKLAAEDDHEDEDVDEDDLPDTDTDGGALVAHSGADSLSINAPRTLPKYLPQELLDAAPAVRPLSPPVGSTLPSLVTASKQNKLAILDLRPPRDVKRGPVKVRVMGDTEHLRYMPPKADAKRGSQREIRDSWLLGREGRHGQAKGVVGSGRVERKSSGGNNGFLRR